MVGKAYERAMGNTAPRKKKGEPEPDPGGWKTWQRKWHSLIDEPGGGAGRLLIQTHALRLRAAPLVGRDVRSHKRKYRSDEKSHVQPVYKDDGEIDRDAAPVKRSHKRGQGIKARAEAAERARLKGEEVAADMPVDKGAEKLPSGTSSRPSAGRAKSAAAAATARYCKLQYICRIFSSCFSIENEERMENCP